MEFRVWDGDNNLIGLIDIKPAETGFSMHIHPPVGEHTSLPFDTAEGAETFARVMVESWKGWAVVEFIKRHGFDAKPGVRVEVTKGD
jgi:hypothetical protein